MISLNMKVSKVNSLLSRGNGLEEKVYKVKGFKAWSIDMKCSLLFTKKDGREFEQTNPLPGDLPKGGCQSFELNDA